MFAIKPPVCHTGAHLVMFPLPASVDDDGLSMTLWEMTDDERDRLMCGGHLRVWIYTNNYSRPVVAEITPPEEVVKES